MSFNAEFMAEIFVSRTRTVSKKKNVSYDFLTACDAYFIIDRSITNAFNIWA